MYQVRIARFESLRQKPIQGDRVIQKLSEEAGRSQAAVVRVAAERGVEPLERAAVRLARLSWVTFAAAVIALIRT